MAFTRVQKDMAVIGKLDDEPNDVGGLTADEFKRKFDEGGLALKEYLNETLLAELEGASCAGSLGIQTIAGLAAANVQAALAALKSAIDGVSAGSIPDASLSTVKLQDLAVTTAKLAELCVTTAKLADNAVTAAKLAVDAVETAKIKDGAVTEAKLAAAAVTSGKLGAGAVGTDNLKDDMLVPVAKGGTGGTNAAEARSALGAQKTISKGSITLTVAGWSNKEQVVNVDGLTGASEFVAAPSTAAGWSAAADSMLYPPTPGSGTLTFTCDTVPTVDIPVTVYFW
jgi:hypothetical protein